MAALALTACAATGPADPPSSAAGEGTEGAIIRVPEDAATISDAVGRATPGDLVLVGAGVHAEQVLVGTPDITVRGVDRNATIIDAEGVRPYGIVATADGVRIENLTVRGATFYGVLVTGLHSEDGEPSARGADGYTTIDPDEFPPVQRFSIDHVTAHNNGLYGLYAFNAQHGVITDSYASGSADSGIYVGQCEQCDILVWGNVAEHNAIGFENANASDSVTVAANRFSSNRVGATFISSYQEAFLPQRANTVVGNLVAENASAESPAQAEGGFGVGIGVSGGHHNIFDRNTVTGHPRAGVQITSVEDIAAVGNRWLGTVFTANAVDVANTSSVRSPATDNCVVDGVSAASPVEGAAEGSAAGAAPAEGGSPAATPIASVRTLPEHLLSACTGEESGGEQPAVESSALPQLTVPPGMSFLQVVAPPPQPTMTDVEVIPARLPERVTMPDLASLTAPAPNYLRDRTVAS